MPLEHRKVFAPTAEEVAALEAEGWTHVGPMPKAPELHRFSREVGTGEPYEADVTLDPKDVFGRIRARLLP